MADTNLTVTFTESEIAVGDVDYQVDLSLDADANNDQTSFSIGDHVFIKQFPTGNVVYHKNIGNFRVSGLNLPYIVEDEYIEFDLDTEAYLSYEPTGPVTMDWIGEYQGPATVVGRKVTIPTEVVAVAKCSYTAYYDQIEASYSGDEEARMLIVGVLGTAKDSIAIDFTAPSTSREVILTVQDYCSGEVVPNAEVTLSGPGYPDTIFNTDVNGEVNFGELVVGNTYDIVIKAVGYHDSDVDYLNNDSFSVEVEP